MAWPFAPKRKPVQGPPNVNERAGSFHIVYERKRMPDPGAQNYAYESLALLQFAPSGPSVAACQQIEPTEGQLYFAQGWRVAGIPTIAGQIITQPLYDPDAPGSGFTRAMPTGYASAMQPNNPFPDNRAA